MDNLNEEETEGENNAPSLPQARIVTDKIRSKDIPIMYPVEFDGKVWKSIPVERCSGEEIEEFVKKLAIGEGDMPPGIKCPPEVWAAMDDDDRYVVEGIYDESFFHQRLRDMANRIPEITEKSSD